MRDSYRAISDQPYRAGEGGGGCTLRHAVPRVKVFENAHFTPPHITEIAEAIVFVVLCHVVVASDPLVDECHFDQVVGAHVPRIADSKRQIFDDIDQRPPDAIVVV